MPRKSNHLKSLISGDSQPINGPTLDWMLLNIGIARTFSILSQFAFSPVFIPAKQKNAKSIFSNYITAKECRKFQHEWAGIYIRLPLAKDFRCRYMIDVLQWSRLEVAQALQVTTDNIRLRLKRTHTLDVSEPQLSEAC